METADANRRENNGLICMKDFSFEGLFIFCHYTLESNIGFLSCSIVL